MFATALVQAGEHSVGGPHEGFALGLELLLDGLAACFRLPLAEQGS